MPEVAWRAQVEGANGQVREMECRVSELSELRASEGAAAQSKLSAMVTTLRTAQSAAKKGSFYFSQAPISEFEISQWKAILPSPDARSPGSSQNGSPLRTRSPGNELASPGSRMGEATADEEYKEDAHTLTPDKSPVGNESPDSRQARGESVGSAEMSLALDKSLKGSGVMLGSKKLKSSRPKSKGARTPPDTPPSRSTRAAKS
jgi:hypothetical protein